MLGLRRGYVAGWLIAALALALGIGLFFSRKTEVKDNRTPIVFWGSTSLGEDIYTLIRQFEDKNPQYRVIMGSAAARDITGDAQRLLCTIAGDVPPDVVWFDRFAIGEWAGRGALTDLQPYLEKQNANDPYRVEMSNFYPWAISEASYAPPGSREPQRIFGIPTDGDIRVLYSNGDVLRQEGLVDAKGNPQPPRDWDELRAYAKKLTRHEDPKNIKSKITRLGFAPNFGNSWLYIYAWQAGGEMLNADRTLVTMDSPQVVRALRFMTDIYDDLGGVELVSGFQKSFQAGALEPFLKNQVAAKIDSNQFMVQIGDWRPTMDFIVTPAPMPADETAKGRPPVAWSGGFALVIPTTAKNKDGAFKLIQYLCSWEGVSLLEQGVREQKETEGRMYLPRGLANRTFFERLIQQYVTDNPKMPPRFKQAYEVVKQLMPKTMIRPVTPVGQFLWAEHVRAYDAAVNHANAAEAKATGMDEVQLSLTHAKVEVQRQLDEILQPAPPTKVSWTPYFFMYALVIAAPFVVMYIAYRRRRREYSYKAREIGAAMMFLSPWLVGMIVFVGGPILFSIVFSFTRYDVLSDARYVGLKNYASVFSDKVFFTSCINTAYMLIRIPLTMAASLSIAMLLNRAVRGIGIYRTAFYLPAIMPLVAASVLWIWVFNPSNGLINQFLGWIFTSPPGHGVEWLISRFTPQPFHFTLPTWLDDKNWSKPALIIMNIWGAGGGMIIWLAGLQSIPPQLYEAAAIDGAGRWQQFKNVTIPMLSPYILFNLIIGVIGTLQIFGEAYIMTAGGPVDSTLFYAYNLFKQAFQFFRMGYASALAWILFVVVLALTLVQLWLSKKWVHYEQA